MAKLNVLNTSISLICLLAANANVSASETDFTTYTDARSNGLSRSTVASEFGISALFNNPAGIQFSPSDNSLKKIIGTSVDYSQLKNEQTTYTDSNENDLSWHTLAFVSNAESFSYGIGVTKGMQARTETWQRHSRGAEQKELSVDQFSFSAAKRIGDTKLGIAYHILDAKFGETYSALSAQGYSLGVQHNAINEYTDLFDTSVNITFDLGASYHSEVYTNTMPVGYQDDSMTLKPSQSNLGANLGLSLLTGKVSSKLNIMAQMTTSTASYVQGRYQEFSAKRLGLEYTVFNALGNTDLQLRAGRQVYSESSQSPSSSYGIGFKSQRFAFDIAIHNALSDRHVTASISYLF